MADKLRKENILYKIKKNATKKKKQIAVLIDPDKFNPEVVMNANKAKVDFIFLGGSEVRKADFIESVNYIKKNSKIPLVIFPGDENQISNKADAILLLSLVSGRNPEYLIGKHIKAAQALKKSKLEVLPTGYILLDGGRNSSTAKISKTIPLSQGNKKSIISTALAAELLGMKLIYLEAGSGAKNFISGEIIKIVKKQLSLPLICGGGIDSREKMEICFRNGADLIVIGNALERNPQLILEFVK